METVKWHENFPLRIVFLTSLFTLFIYGICVAIISQLGLLVSFLYLFYVIILEYRLLKYHCVNCYYYGKTCGFGKGRLSSLLFRKGDSTKFCQKKITWMDMIYDLMVSLIPVLAGLVMLIIKFDLLLLLGILSLIGLSTAGNAYIRGQLACKFCKQRELGCPAYELFEKKS